MLILNCLSLLAVGLPLCLRLARPTELFLRVVVLLFAVDILEWLVPIRRHGLKTAGKALKHRLVVLHDRHQRLIFNVWHAVLEVEKIPGWVIRVVWASFAVVCALNVALLAL